MRRKNFLEKEVLEYNDILDRLEHLLSLVAMQINELNTNYNSNRILTLVSRKKLIESELGRIANQLVLEALDRDRKKKKKEEKEKMKSIFIPLIFILLSISLQAQTPLVFRVKAPLQPTCVIEWTHDGLDTKGNPVVVTGWAVALNGIRTSILTATKTSVPITNSSAGTYQIPCPAILIGNTILVVYAESDLGESAPSTEIQIILDPPDPVKLAPGPATNVKVGGQ